MTKKLRKQVMLLVWLLLLMEAFEKVEPSETSLTLIVGRIGISVDITYSEQARTDWKKRNDLESELKNKGYVKDPGSAASYHMSLSEGGDPQMLNATRERGFIQNRIASLIWKKENFTLDQLKGIQIAEDCPKPPTCTKTKYRSIDGSCNNKDNPSWGKSFTRFERLLDPKYDDGLNSPRTKGSNGEDLPCPRKVSSEISPDVNAPSPKITMYVMQWGQFIDHDLTLTASSTGPNGTVDCCNEQVRQNTSLQHSACFPICVPDDDPFYSKHNVTCMQFIRSAAAPSDPSDNCTLGPREQLNMLTHFIDGSMIYGSTCNESLKLRTFEGGKLRPSKTEGNDTMPPAEGGACKIKDKQRPCFLAGDGRVNEQTNLAVLHHICFREHNRIAEELSRMHPEWCDEIIYQESRRIVGAIIQHITYNEFLPAVLGKDIMREFGLNLLKTGHSDKYDPKTNPTVINCFAAAAFRFGHTLIQGIVALLSSKNKVTDNLPLVTQFFNPVIVYDNISLDSACRGMSATPSQDLDPFLTDQVTQHLFQPEGKDFGLDLCSLNIQRGRDHALPDYNAWRIYFGFSKIENPAQLKTYIKEPAAEKMTSLYGSADDIDLFIAGISEKRLENSSGILPPTFAHIVAEQFRRSKHGDSFWYENGNMPSSFTEAQLNEIRKCTLSKLLCRNSDIQFIQKNAFLLASKGGKESKESEECKENKAENPVVSCEEFPWIDLKHWENESVPECPKNCTS